jgi:hypothetical protein
MNKIRTRYGLPNRYTDITIRRQILTHAYVKHQTLYTTDDNEYVKTKEIHMDIGGKV